MTATPSARLPPPRPDRLDEIRERWAKATKGPWGWFGNTSCHDIYLATLDRGRVFVMGFRRWGLQRAQPVFRVQQGDAGVLAPSAEMVVYERTYRKDFHDIDNPDARAISASPEDVAWLLAEVDRLRRTLHEADVTPWPQAAQERVALQENVAAMAIKIQELEKELVEAKKPEMCDGCGRFPPKELRHAAVGVTDGLGSRDQWLCPDCLGDLDEHEPEEAPSGEAP